MDPILRAYEDVAFLKSEVCRPVRLQLELLRPEVLMHEHGVRSTIVLFGSARLPEPEKAAERLRQAQRDADAKPNSADAVSQLERARYVAELSRYYDVAREFSRLVSSTCQIQGQCDYVVVTGGGGGVMEAGNRGAHDVGAKSMGLNISLPYEQHTNPYITRDLTFCFHYFSIRKMHFLLRAKGMCAFPGGFGTLDELFEALTLIQTRKIAPIPVLLFGRDFWEGLIDWDRLVKAGMIDRGDLDMFQFFDSAQDGWDFIQDFWRRR